MEFSGKKRKTLSVFHRHARVEMMSAISPGWLIWILAPNDLRCLWELPQYNGGCHEYWAAELYVWNPLNYWFSFLLAEKKAKRNASSWISPKLIITCGQNLQVYLQKKKDLNIKTIWDEAHPALEIWSHFYWRQDGATLRPLHIYPSTTDDPV